MMTNEMKTIVKGSYKVLKNAYVLNGTVFCPEFDRAKTLASCRMGNMIETLRQSSYDLWKLGLLSKEQCEAMNDTADKLQNFVSLAVQHFNNLEKMKSDEVYYGHEYDYIKETKGLSDKDMVSLYGTKEEYTKSMVEDIFDFYGLDDDLEHILRYFNLIK